MLSYIAFLMCTKPDGCVQAYSAMTPVPLVLLTMYIQEYQREKPELMHMKKFLTLAIVFFATPLFGAEPKGKAWAGSFPSPKTEGYANWDSWILFSSSASGADYYVKRIVGGSDKIDFWLKVEEKALPPCTVESGRNSFLESPYEAVRRANLKRLCENTRENEVASSVSHVVFACRTRKAKYLERATYNEHGNSLGTSIGKDQWVAIFPDTVMDSLFERLCAQ